MPKKIVVTEMQYSSGQMVDLSTSLIMSGTRKESFHRPLTKKSTKYLKKVGPVGTKLIKKILVISGVIEVEITPYRLKVYIGVASDLSVVKKTILNMLAKHLFNVPLDDIEVENK